MPTDQTKSDWPAISVFADEILKATSEHDETCELASESRYRRAEVEVLIEGFVKEHSKRSGGKAKTLWVSKKS